LLGLLEITRSLFLSFALSLGFRFLPSTLLHLPL
jgi:hypothetical protein